MKPSSRWTALEDRRRILLGVASGTLALAAWCATAGAEEAGDTAAAAQSPPNEPWSGSAHVARYYQRARF